MVALQPPEASPDMRPGPVTWEDFVALPEDDTRELIDGELVEVDVPTYDHEAIVAALVYFFYGWSREHGGRVLASGYKVKVSSRRGLMPDVQYYRAGRQPPLQALTEGAPDLGVEVVSPSSGRYDWVTKLNDYRSIGMPEYWIIDPMAQSLHRLVLIDGSYRVEAFMGDAVVTPDTFQGLGLPLAELWAACLTGEPPTPPTLDPPLKG